MGSTFRGGVHRLLARWSPARTLDANTVIHPNEDAFIALSSSAPLRVLCGGKMAHFKKTLGTKKIRLNMNRSAGARLQYSNIQYIAAKETFFYADFLEDTYAHSVVR